MTFKRGLGLLLTLALTLSWTLSFASCERSDGTNDATGHSDSTQTTAQPDSETHPTVYVTGATVTEGNTAEVTVAVKNNTGIAGARFYINYSAGLTLKSATAGEAFDVLDYTPPYELTSPCPFNWDSLDAVAREDGTILTLTFEIPDDAASGTEWNVLVSYARGDVYDYDLNDVEMAIDNTYGIIKKQ